MSGTCLHIGSCHSGFLPPSDSLSGDSAYTDKSEYGRKIHVALPLSSSWRFYLQVAFLQD